MATHITSRIENLMAVDRIIVHLHIQIQFSKFKPINHRV